MGFRFRKSINAGPFRVNFSKSGVGYSVGGKGYRYTKKVGGGTRTTASISGTGISYVKETGTKKEMGDASMNPNSGKSTETRYCKFCYRILSDDSNICPACGKSQTESTATTSTPKLTGMHIAAIVIIALTVILAVASCNHKDTDTVITEPPETIISTVIEEPMESIEPTYYTVGFPELSPAEKIYVLNTSSMKFHVATCESVDEIKDSNKDTFTGTREDVISKGYEPCGRCNP